MALVPPADVAAGDAASVVAASGALERREKTLLRLALGHLLKRGKVLVACGRGDGLEIFQWHDSRNGVLVAFGAAGGALRSDPAIPPL